MELDEAEDDSIMIKPAALRFAVREAEAQRLEQYLMKDEKPASHAKLMASEDDAKSMSS